ncbi:hypothetical protein BDN72DRAFT_777649, partial [Pluteus cervinus]
MSKETSTDPSSGTIGATIHHLPPELLAKIFLYLQRLWPSAHFSYSLEEQEPWMVVTKICRHWRDVAHESPELWTYIPHSSPKLVERWLRLSKSVPI